MSRRRITCRCGPAPTSPCVTALAHVIVTEGLMDEAFIRERCDWDEFQDYAEFVADPRHAPRRPRR